MSGRITWIGIAKDITSEGLVPMDADNASGFSKAWGSFRRAFASAPARNRSRRRENLLQVAFNPGHARAVRIAALAWIAFVVCVILFIALKVRGDFKHSRSLRDQVHRTIQQGLGELRKDADAADHAAGTATGEPQGSRDKASPDSVAIPAPGGKSPIDLEEVRGFENHL